jgi:predicted nucleic-acid-binding Zn-ribbon protein
MKKNQKCPKCASSDIAIGAEPTAGGAHTVYLETYRRKLGGLVQPVEASTRLTTYVCRECGFVEIYADEPLVFKSAKAL